MTASSTTTPPPTGGATIVRIAARRGKIVKALIPRFLTLHNPYASDDQI